MFLKIRITFSILAAICATAAIFVFIFADWVWGTVVIALALIFSGLMYVCRSKQLEEEQKKPPEKREGDFITGKADKDD